MDKCDYCTEDCMMCYLGNPCLGCKDYDEYAQSCKSNGACGDIKKEVQDE